ncbi:elongation factor P maturation arginine rhamnosyltransferase EarP [Microbulbifer sp. SH-1]|uniref:elongation factor P maturation arginine rhamnosyltransferase EarP n=1 Tax=Microbulbifer sp. SH-1 TaxID=2681547 RepID=UPI0014085CCB|nr:elongation factor P maturation arginine rhamnosyltransferase EarP [Microbulbifer sp. SH-1]QIL88697.1 elongation factor P maturation arginine rhamnosyltransferase EarP [Microbulbifer sp. SH-1]
MSNRWDIFCRVVDNYGDIGVTWRLARQLAAEYGLVVRLWVDEPAAFLRLCPAAEAPLSGQCIEGVEVRHWPVVFPPVEVADVVIEAFACHLPMRYVEAMAARQHKPLWLNLEYLSAEAWVTGCHGLPSPQAGGLPKFFFFPGFVDGTGGLLRERNLLAQRRAFQAAPGARGEFLAHLGVRPAGNTRLISLFAYENASLAGWLTALAADRQPTLLLVPRGRIEGELQRWFGAQSSPGHCWRRGNLQVQLLPFLRQQDYDRLLWSCDVNAVRGEDSFVRAQWAGRPLLWHIYPQEEGAHWTKLDAFLDLYCSGLSPQAGAAQKSLWHAWNGRGNMHTAWVAAQPQMAALSSRAEGWCREQAKRPDLALALVRFHRNWLLCAA